MNKKIITPSKAITDQSGKVLNMPKPAAARNQAPQEPAFLPLADLKLHKQYGCGLSRRRCLITSIDGSGDDMKVSAHAYNENSAFYESFEVMPFQLYAFAG